MVLSNSAADSLYMVTAINTRRRRSFEYSPLEMAPLNIFYWQSAPNNPSVFAFTFLEVKLPWSNTINACLASRPIAFSRFTTLMFLSTSRVCKFSFKCFGVSFTISMFAIVFLFDRASFSLYGSSASKSSAWKWIVFFDFYARFSNNLLVPRFNFFAVGCGIFFFNDYALVGSFIVISDSNVSSIGW